MNKKWTAILMAAMLSAALQSVATTEIFNLGFDGDLAGFTAINDPVVPTGVLPGVWTKCSTGSPVEQAFEGGSVVNSYMFNGNVRGIAITLDSGFTPGTRYTLSARAIKNYGGGNQRVAIAATQVEFGSGDIIMDNFYNGADESYQPVVTNSGNATVTNVLQKTLNVNNSWQTLTGTFIYNDSLGSNLVIQLQCFDTGGTSGAIRYDDFILSDNRAPQFSTNVIVVSTGFVGVAYSESIASFVDDLEGDSFTIEKDPGDTSWINVSSGGLVTGTPDAAGTYNVTLYAWDDQGSDTNSATLQIVASDADLAPSWPLAGFDMGYVAAGQPYSDSLSGRVIELNGEEITFSENGSGPVWLTIGSDGSISGTPASTDLGTNSWSVIASDGTLNSTSSFEIVVISATPVYEEIFTPAVDMAGFFNNTVEGSARAYVTTELQTGMWAHTFSTNSGAANLWDTDGLTDMLEFAESGDGSQTEGVGTVIPAATFAGEAGQYVLTYTYVTNDYYDAVSRVGARVYEASRGTNATVASDYYLQLSGTFVFNLGVEIPAGSDATASLIANDSVSDTLGYRMLPFDYSGSNDVALIFGTFTPDGRGRAAIDNIRVFRLPPGYDEWESGYGLTEGKTGDDDEDGVDNLTEFGLGLDPTVPGGVDDGALPAFSNAGSGLTYVMAQRIGGGTLNFNLLTTDNLVFGPWVTNNTPTDFTVGGSSSDGSFNYVTNVIDTTDGQKFIKPLVTEAP